MVFICDPTSIVALDAETDGVNGFTELDGAEDVDTFTCGSKHYAISVSSVDDGVLLIDITDPTNILAVDAETDGVNGFDLLAGSYNVEAFKIDNKPYALVASYTDKSVTMIEMSCSK